MPRHAKPLVLDFDDIDSASFAHAVAAKPWGGLGGKVGQSLVQRKLDAIVENAIDTFGAVTITSDEDRDYLPKRPADAVILPNIAYSDAAAGESPALPPDFGAGEICSSATCSSRRTARGSTASARPRLAERAVAGGRRDAEHRRPRVDGS